jgi:hypothetical protein
MEDRMSDSLLEHLIRRNPPRSQQAGLRLGVRQSLASIGPVDMADIPHAATGIAKGLFGSAWDAADEDQRFEWRRMAIVEYRGALLDAMPLGDVRALWDAVSCEDCGDGFCCDDIHAALNRKGDGAYCTV